MRTILSFFLLGFTVALFAQSTVTFELSDLPTSTTKKVGIRGNVYPLSWYETIPLKKEGNRYQLSLQFPDTVKSFEYKFVLFESTKDVQWENIENRIEQLEGGTNFTFKRRWNVEKYIDPTNLPMIPAASLAADYRLIETMVKEVHPGTYRYNDQASIGQALNELKKSFSKDLSYADAYLAISALLAKLQCDHTFASYTNQNALIKSIILRQKDKLPFTFRWIEEKMIVCLNASEQPLERGTEVVEINGTPAAEILQAVIQYGRANGATFNNRIAQAEIKGYNFRIDAFDVFFPLLFPVDSMGIRLKVRTFGTNSIQEISVKPLTRRDRNKRLRTRYPDFPTSYDDLWKFDIIDGEIGYLKIGTFVNMGINAIEMDWRQFLADAFAEMKRKKIEALIVDIRENEGGNDDIPEELGKYIIQQSFTTGNRDDRSRYLSFPEQLKPYSKSWGNPWYYELKTDLPKSAEGYYSFPEACLPQTFKPGRKAFKGEIYLLTSAYNTSGAFYFAHMSSTYKLATLVGQETGGNMRGINGGQILFMRLPASQIEIDYPVTGSFFLQNQPNHGVKPDIYVRPNIADIQAGIDTEIVAVKALIKSKK